MVGAVVVSEREAAASAEVVAFRWRGVAAKVVAEVANTQLAW